MRSRADRTGHRLTVPAIGVIVTLALGAGCSSASSKAHAGSSDQASSTLTSSPEVTGSASPESTQAAPAGPSSSPAAVSPVASSISTPPCDGVKYTRIVTRDGIGLGVVELGTGKRGVLMLPEYQASACQWAVEASGLVSAGFHVLLLEYRCTIPSDCPSDTDRQSDLSLDAQAGVAALRVAGVTKVVIVGASAGGTLAVVAGAASGPLVNGVVDLSGPGDVSYLYGTAQGRINSLAAAPHLLVPSLFVVSKDDPSTSVEEITAVYNAVPKKPKQLMVLPAEGGHGWDTLAYAGPEGNVQDTLYVFLRAND